MSQVMIQQSGEFDERAKQKADRQPQLRQMDELTDDASHGLARSGIFYRPFGKRALDLVLTGIVLVPAAPVLILVWLGLRLTLGSEIVLRQDRVGRCGEAFDLLKFRTMQKCRRCPEQQHSFDETERRLTHKSHQDPRHTRLGRIVRKFSLDELPQLVNILKGDMSLVGPRPELVSVANREFLEHVRHDVRPGLTGPFQVSDLRGSGDLHAGLDLDEAYVANLGLVGDLRYLAGTTTALVRGTGS